MSEPGPPDGRAQAGEPVVGIPLGRTRRPDGSREAAAATPAERPSEPRATYVDLRYRDVFWAERPYEDASDRAALRALLPRSGRRLLDVGAGFGRLVDEYSAYREVVLIDASEAHVDAARKRSAGDPRVTVIQGDAAAMPLPDSSVDAVVCIRVLHHLEDPRPVIGEIARVLRPGGRLVVEVANKRNAKAVVRWLLGRQPWSPLGPGPVSYRPVHFDHAPADVRRWLEEAGLGPDRALTASLFRYRPLTRRVPVRVLLALERPLQRLLAPLTPGPSLFLRARRLDRPRRRTGS